MDFLATKLFIHSCFPNTVFVALLRTAVHRTISEAHKLLRHWRVLHLFKIVVLSVADSMLLYVHSLLLLLKCCFTSTETVGLFGTGAQVMK